MENLWEFNHVGLMVNSRDKTLDYYLSLGIGLSVGPQPLPSPGPGPGEVESESLVRRKLYGERVSVTRTVSSSPGRRTFYDGEVQMGSLQLEVIGADVQMNEVNRDFLESYGEGISHICYNVPDPEGETARLVEKGCEVVWSVGGVGRIGENYVHNSNFGNVWISFRPPASEWEKRWKENNMTYSLVSSWKFRGLGVAVRDVDKVVECYQSLEVGMPDPEAMFDSSSVRDFKMCSEAPDTTVKDRTRMLQIGSVGYEFIQPLEGESVYRRSLESGGEGVKDIAFTVDDLERETAKLAEKGVPTVCSGKPDTGDAFAYFDTRKLGNLMVRLIQEE